MNTTRNVRITSTNLTDSQIRSLQIEAGMAGDTETIKACARALDGSQRARVMVARILRDA
jgi:hypothetical protein